MGRGPVKLKRVAPFAAALVALLAAAAPIASGNAPKPWRPTFHPLLRGAPGVPASAGRAADCSGVVQCSTVVVPLDRTGQLPGTISLHVEVVPAQGTPRGAMFLIAGGPGQGSAHVFGLDNANAVSEYRFLFPGYTLVAYDDRGTGASGLIDCPAVQVAITPEQNRAAADACARAARPRSRLLLDGRARGGPGGGPRRPRRRQDRALRRLLRDEARAGIRARASRPRRAARARLGPPRRPGRPVRRERPEEHAGQAGRVLLRRRLPRRDEELQRRRGRGRERAGGKAAVGKGAARERQDDHEEHRRHQPARHRPRLRPEPRPRRRASGGHPRGTQREHAAAAAARLPARARRDHPVGRPQLRPVPRDGLPGRPVPVGAGDADRATPADPRRGGRRAPAPTRSGRSASGPTSSATPTPASCWPSPSGGAALGPGPLPDVPVLAISGGYDMRTPTDGAQTVVSRFRAGPAGRRARESATARPPRTTRAARRRSCGRSCSAAPSPGRAPARRRSCRRSRPFRPPARRSRPSRSARCRPTRSPRGRSRDAEAIWIGAARGALRSRASGAASSRPVRREFTLTRYAIAQGVAVSGRIKLTTTSLPLRFQGTLTVTGPAASTGLLGLNGTSLRGTLGGRIVGR